jgi:hypothetical protein
MGRSVEGLDDDADNDDADEDAFPTEDAELLSIHASIRSSKPAWRLTRHTSAFETSRFRNRGGGEEDTPPALTPLL